MSRAWRWVLPCYLLLVPNTLIAFLYAMLWCRARSWAWRDGVLTFVATRPMVGGPDGQGWSWIVGYASAGLRDLPDLRVHENVHVAQEFACALLGAAIGLPLWFVLGASWAWLPVALCNGGALFALAYGGAFAWSYATSQADERPGWVDDYRRNPFEVHAYAVQARYLAARPVDRVRYWGAR